MKGSFPSYNMNNADAVMTHSHNLASISYMQCDYKTAHVPRPKPLIHPIKKAQMQSIYYPPRTVNPYHGIQFCHTNGNTNSTVTVQQMPSRIRDYHLVFIVWLEMTVAFTSVHLRLNSLQCEYSLLRFFMHRICVIIWWQRKKKGTVT